MANDLLSIFEHMERQPDEKGMTYNSKVLLVDATNLFMRTYCAVPSMDEDGNHIGGMVGFLKSLGLAIRTFKPTRVVVVFDGAGGSQRRKKLYPDYKSKRKPALRLNRAYDLTTDAQESENMKYQLVTLVEILEHLPLTTIAMDLIEADDVIAHLSHLVVADGGSCIIHSSDKDFYQLVTDKVVVYSPIKKKTFDVDAILEEFGIHPTHFPFFRALNGDTSDNIPGIKGIGLTTLKKYLPELADPSLTVDVNLVEQKYGSVKKPPKVMKNILDNNNIVNRNLQLMNLQEGIISSDSKLKISKRYAEVLSQINKHGLTKLMYRGKLLGAFPNYDSWITQTFLPLTRFKE